MRAADAAAVAAGTSIETLMTRAAWAVAASASGLLGGTYGKRIVIVCGIGNNAGDGLAAARVLSTRGATVDVIGVLGDAFREGAAAAARKAWRAPLLPADGLHDVLERADLVIDALFGVGLSRDVDGLVQKVMLAINGSGVPVLSVDVPSGIDADTGQERGDAISATVTVTFGAIKPGLRFPPGRTRAGRVEVVDIGLRSRETPVQAVEAVDVGRLWPRRTADSHKRNTGTLLLVAGSEAMPGAAILAARAAVASGAGLVYVATPRRIAGDVAGACPEAIPVAYEAPWLDAMHARELLEHVGSIDAIAIGPGLGREVGTLAAVRTLLEHLDIPAVVDADALQAIPVVARTAPTIVTPHAGEWSVITERNSDEVAKDRLAAARALVETLSPRIPGVIGVLKGPGTLIATDDACFLDLDGGAELSQGGSGDVLTGILGALIAGCARALHGIDAERIAAGVWVHSRAARLSADGHASREPAGAGRIIERIPAAIGEATSAGAP